VAGDDERSFAQIVDGALHLTPITNAAAYLVSQGYPLGLGDWSVEIKFRYVTDGAALPIDVQTSDLVGKDPVPNTRCFQIYQDGNITVSLQAPRSTPAARPTMATT